MVKSYSDMLLVPFAKYLKKYGTLELSNMGGSVLIPNDNASYNSILFKPKRLPYSADKSWEFIASVRIIEQEIFSKEHVELYQRLKGMECTLVRKGKIRRKYIMEPKTLLHQLQQEIPKLQISTYLSEIINQELQLENLFSIISPDSLTISLFNPPINTKDLSEYCKQFKNHYDSPTDIIMNINLEKYLEGIISKKKYLLVIDSIFQALEILALSLRRATQLVESRL